MNKAKLEALAGKARAAAGDIAAIIAAILGILPGLLKKKPHKLLRWQKLAKVWERQNDSPHSVRQCRKLQAELVRLGDDPRLFVILPWDAKAPANGPEGLA